MLLGSFCLSVLLPTLARSFLVGPRPQGRQGPSPLRLEREDLSEKFEKFAEFRTTVRSNVLRSLKEDSVSMQLLVVAQASLFVLLAVGVVPVVGDALEVLSGPGFLVLGTGLCVAGILDLGPKNLTPSTAPVAGNELKTNGVYAFSRHPIYTGILLGATGLAVATHSFQRVIVTLLLYLLLDYKATKEERDLADIHPAYPAYQSTVPKLLPGLDSILNGVIAKFDDDDDDAGLLFDDSNDGPSSK
mmetsp:Transcript_2394/g.8072  ORF Transcript_2394/g.8072 Transcript_2394/m.8072 type:complete len:245 (+) Transcript_2394:619-1353(+)